MNKKKSIVSLLMGIVFIFCLNSTFEAAGLVEDVIVEIDSDGKLRKGSTFQPDKPVFRPMYQGDYSLLFTDMVGPLGPFTGFYDPSNNNATSQHLQSVKVNDTAIMKNIGSYQGKKVALKVKFLFNGSWNFKLGILSDGSVYMGSLYEHWPIRYQLVYDEPDYPIVTNIYLDLPSEFILSSTGINPELSSRIRVVSSNLKKFYVNVPETWWEKYPLDYSIISETVDTMNGKQELFQVAGYGLPLSTSTESIPYSNSIITDNNQQTVLMARSSNFTGYIKLFQSDIRVPYTPQYLPIRVNIPGNSDKFEAKYDVGQTVSNTYDNFLPDTVRMVVEDQEGYFEKLDQKNFEFTDKDGNDITELIELEKITNSKLEFKIGKQSLKQLKTNQVNVKLAFNELNKNKVVANFDEEKNVYHVPLTFYNVCQANGTNTKSEETHVNATIVPNVYGEPKPIEVLLGTSTEDLDPIDLIENAVTMLPEDTLRMNFVDQQIFSDEKVYDVSIKLSSTATPSVTKTVIVPVTAKKGVPITSDFFENQSWIITNINEQLKPKKIDRDVYESDLLQIKKIEILKAPPKVNEHIPATIDSLVNLTDLHLANQKLVGKLPTTISNLAKLTNLSIYGNTFESEIPSSLGNLIQIQTIRLDSNNLKGTIPVSLSLLPNLKEISLKQNKLSGNLPDFPMNMDMIALENNQITYNLASVPTFLTSARTKTYDNTFLAGLKLTAKPSVRSKTTEIKPFNEGNTGYFNLKATQDATPPNVPEDLYDEHIYTIKNAVDGTIYYTGKKNIDVTIPYKKEISYKVILDYAEKNPNNNVTILSKQDEFRFEETPKSIHLQTKLGNKDQAVELDGQIAILDNRENRSWKLSITPSQLTQGSQLLSGEYSYTNKAGVKQSIVTGEKFLMEKGQSDSVEEVIPISASWNASYGLNYTAYSSNHVGNYSGTVEWTLEDAP